MNARTVVRFVLRYAEMVIVMIAGMMLFAPLWRLAFGDRIVAHPDLNALVMATNMAVAMALWMAIRRHGLRGTLEMTAVMYLPFLLLLVPYWVGLIDGGALMVWGHVLMFVAMFGLMLLRRDEYAHHAPVDEPAVDTPAV